MSRKVSPACRESQHDSFHGSPFCVPVKGARGVQEDMSARRTCWTVVDLIEQPANLHYCMYRMQAINIKSFFINGLGKWHNHSQLPIAVHSRKARRCPPYCTSPLGNSKHMPLCRRAVDAQCMALCSRALTPGRMRMYGCSRGQPNGRAHLAPHSC